MVSHVTARRLLDVQKTKYWQLVKDGKIEITEVGNSTMAKYASLKRLAKPDRRASGPSNNHCETKKRRAIRPAPQLFFDDEKGCCP